MTSHDHALNEIALIVRSPSFVMLDSSMRLERSSF